MYYFSVTSIRCKCFRHLINSYNYQRKKTKKEKEKEAINAVNHSGYTSICDAVNAMTRGKTKYFTFFVFDVINFLYL